MNRIMVIGEKETFLIRVLLKKIQDSGIEAAFTPQDVNLINAKWEGTTLITCYFDTGEVFHEDVRRFLIDKMLDDNKQMVVIGDKSDIKFICDKIPHECIYKTYERPLDGDMFIKDINELMTKIEAGDFKKSILVVDDDPTYLGVVREWLKDFYKVSMVSSGLQAIKWLGKNKTDLILLDYEMPITSGPQVLEMLRGDLETANIPVIFLTGKSDKESVVAVLALKPEGYFLKSIGREELLKNLNDYFAMHK